MAAAAAALLTSQQTSALRHLLQHSLTACWSQQPLSAVTAAAGWQQKLQLQHGQRPLSTSAPPSSAQQQGGGQQQAAGSSSRQEQQQQQPRRTAEVGRLNHVAIAVPDLQAAAARYRDVLGAKVSAPQHLPEHGVTTVFVELPNAKLELLAPLGQGSPIARFLQRSPAGGIHHICLEVADVRSSLAALGPAGVRVLDPLPKIGAHGNPVVFLHPKDNDGVLMELEEVEGQQQQRRN